MRDWWLKFGCYLTGHKYELIKHCSIASEKAVHKYSSAILVVSLIWGFIGFSFTHIYLKGGLIGSITGAVILVLVVIQIERQIILTVGKNLFIIWFRGSLAVIMAIIGSIIIDQIIFKDDVEIIRPKVIASRVNELLPIENERLNFQIMNRDSLINAKEQERINLVDRVRKVPKITIPTIQTHYQRDSSGLMVAQNQTITNQILLNPEASLIPSIGIQIDTLRAQKSRLELQVLTSRERIDIDQKKHKPFLDDLKILVGLLINSPIAFIFWLLLWGFFFLIEVLVLMSKLADNKNDYEQIVLHQMNIRIEQLKVLDNNE